MAHSPDALACSIDAMRNGEECDLPMNCPAMLPSFLAATPDGRDGSLLLSRMSGLLDTIRAEIATRLDELRPLAREASDLQRALDALDRVPTAPNGDRRGERRQRGQHPGSRRPRRARGDIGLLIVEYVAANPGSTARAVADALGLKRSSVATRLTGLARRGDLVKAPRGYSAP
jgi:hypothetical protein